MRPRRGSGPVILKYTRGHFGFALLESRHQSLEPAIRESHKLFLEGDCTPVEISAGGKTLTLDDMREHWKSLGLTTEEDVAENIDLVEISQEELDRQAEDDRHE